MFGDGQYSSRRSREEDFLPPSWPAWLLPDPVIHSVVVVVNPDIALQVDRYADRVVHLFGARSEGAELGHVFAFFVEDLNAVVSGVGDPDVAVGVDGQALRFRDLAVA